MYDLGCTMHYKAGYSRFEDVKLSALQSTVTTYLLLEARGENIKSPDTNELIRMNADAIAPLGHINFEMSQRRRDAIKPNGNKNDATLCACVARPSVFPNGLAPCPTKKKIQIV